MIEARAVPKNGEPEKRSVAISMLTATGRQTLSVFFDLSVEEAIDFRAQLDQVIAEITAAREGAR